MGAKLYSADLLETAKPVKQQRKRKEKVTVDVAPPASPPPTTASVSETPSEPTDPIEVEEPSVKVKKEKKEKKPLSEKQIAALEKAKEARRLKKEQIEKEKQEALEQERLKKEEEERKVAEKLAKKEATKEKRRLARLAKKEASASHVDDAQEPPAKKAKKSRDNAEPPEWFKKYIHGVKVEQSKVGTEKKSQRAIKEEVSEEAKQKWDDSHTRDRVTHEVDNHMNRMYSMIFGQRRMVQ